MSCACLFKGKGTEETDLSVSVRVHDFCVCPEEETHSSALPPPPAPHPLSPPENAAVTPFRSPRQTVPSDPGFLSPSHPHLRPKPFPISPAFSGSLNLCRAPPPAPRPKPQPSCPAAGAVRGGYVDLNRTPPGGVDPHTARKVREEEINSRVLGGADIET